MPLHLQLFGPLRLSGDGAGPVPHLRLRAQRLLAFIWLRRASSLERDRTAFQLWPDQPENVAQSTLRRALSDLRSALSAAGGPDRIVVQSNELRWQSGAGDWLDVEQFEQLVRKATPQALYAAVALYTQDLLPGWGDEWLTGERERLQQMRLEALGGLVAHYQALGEYERAIQFAQNVIELDPLAEAAQSELIRLHYAAGDRAAALAHYARFRSRLWEELGVEPMAETLALAEAITRGAPLPAPPRRQASGAAPAAVQVPLPPPIGREAEMAQLGAWWDEAARGAGRLGIVSGEAGVGKSRLAAALAEQATRQGGLSLVGQSYEFENALPYQAIIEMLRSTAPLLRHLMLAPAHRAMLARLAPDVMGAAGEPLGEPGAAPDDRRGLLFEALLQAFISLSHSQPLLFVFEDVHWAALSTLDWLIYAAPRIRANRVLILVTYRTGESDAPHTLARLSERFARQGPLASLAVQPLSRAAHQQLVAQLAGLGLQTMGPMADRLFAETGGNPFFLHEMVRGLIEAGQLKVIRQQWSGPLLEAASAARLPMPPSLRATIAARVDRLHEMDRMLLRLAAVAGRVFDYEVVRRAGNWPDEMALAAVESLALRGFVRESEAKGAFAFSHHLVQEAIYADLTVPRRAYLHRRLAEAIASWQPGDYPALVHHWSLAGDAQQEARYAALAGEQAMTSYANDEAIQYLERALALTADAGGRVGLMLRLAQVWHLTGQWSQAETICRAALALTDALTEPGPRAGCQAALGRLARLQGRYAEAQGWLEQAQAIYETLGDQPGLSEVAAGLGAVYWAQLDFGRALESFERQLRIAQALHDRRKIALALGSVGVVYTDMRNYPQALAHIERSLQIDLELGDQLRLARGIGNLGVVYHGQGDDERALVCYARMLQVALEVGDRQGVLVAAGNMINLFTQRGDTSAAEQAARLALGLARRLDMPMYWCEFLHDAVELYAQQGRYAEAQAANEETLAIAARARRVDVTFPAQVMSIRLRFQLRQIEAAQAIAQLESLLAGRADEHETAALHYAIWQIDPARADDRRLAAEAYRRLVAETPTAAYRERYQALTGEAPPQPRALPELPAWLRDKPADAPGQLAQVDQLLIALGVERA